MNALEETQTPVITTVAEPTVDEDAAEDLSWQESSLCSQTDPEMFFPDKGKSPSAAKQICDRCDVREQCLQYALAHNERFGIWGGMTTNQRDQLRRSDSQRPITPPQPRITGALKKARDTRIVLMARNGTSAAAIAVEHGISERSVHRVLAAARKRAEAETELLKSA